MLSDARKDEEERATVASCLPGRVQAGGGADVAMSLPEQPLCLSNQVMPEAFDLTIGAVDQCLKISLQMSPAPLQTMATR